MANAYAIIKRPLFTEKATRLKETGGDVVAPESPESLSQKVLFEVARDANKHQIREAIERLFNVNVADVRTLIVRGKERRIGRFAGRRPNWKKAVVTLKPGQAIEFFEGV